METVNNSLTDGNTALVAPPVGIAAVAISTGIVIGALSSSSAASALLAMALLGSWLILVRFRPDLGLGFWVLFATNTLPFVDTGIFKTIGLFGASDLAIAGLGLGVAIQILSGRRWVPPSRGLTMVSVVFVGVWICGFLKSTVMTGVPADLAALFGRDLLFFFVALLLAPMYVAGEPSRRMHAMAVAAMGAVTFAVGQITYQVLSIRITAIYHPRAESLLTGIARPYTWATILVWLLIVPCLCLGLSDGVQRRRLWLAAGLLMLAATILGQTRALYLGTAVAMASGLVMMARLRSGRWIQRSYFVLAVAVVVLGLGLTLDWRIVENPTAVIYDRLASLAHVANGDDMIGNWEYRKHLASVMLDKLDDQWLWGLGFLHPAASPVSGLPDGNIRNDDLGMMQLLMTLGAIGVVVQTVAWVILILPALRRLFRSLRADVSNVFETDVPLVMGCLATLLGGMAASMTIGTFVDGPAAMAAAFVAAVLVTCRLPGSVIQH